ncbi:MAG: hypothetical protein RhofKO_29750 [Rhodothermales bacterium]
MPEKTYTEAEVAALLGQAVQLQQARGGDSNAPTLTLAEVKAAAAEAGIDARFVELAASSGEGHEQTYFGLPVGRDRSVTVDHALTDAIWQQMVGVFVRTFGGPGEVSIQGGQRRWTRAGVTMTADALGKQTVVHAEARLNVEMPIVLLIVGFAATLMVGLVGFAGQEWTVGLAALFFSALVLGGYMRTRNTGRQKLAETEQHMHTALNQCAALMLEPSSEPARPDTETARIDAELLSEESTSASGSQIQGRRARP